MGSAFYYLVFFCAANLAFSAAKPTTQYENGSTYERNAISAESAVEALELIQTFVEPPWSSESVVDTNTREIFIQSGTPFEDSARVDKLFRKYFDGSSLRNFTFTGNGFASFNRTKEGIARYALKIDPLEPGVYQFEYEGLKQGMKNGNNWTVHSIRTHAIRKNAFFEIVHNLTRYEVTSKTEIVDSQLVGVMKRKDPKSFLIYGLADGLKNGTILNIGIRSRKERKWPLTRVWLRIDEPRSRESSRRNRRGSNSMKEDQIQVWMADFNGTISSKRKMAECVAAGYGASYLDLEEVNFGNDNRTTVFKAQLPDRVSCGRLGTIAQRIKECPFNVMAYKLTCATGENKFGPKEFFTTTAAPGTSSTRRGSEKEEDSKASGSDDRRNGKGLNSMKWDKIQVWMADFDETSTSKTNMAQCVAASYGAIYPDLKDVNFGNDARTTVFKAQLRDRDSCKWLSAIAQRIMECPFKMMAYNLTCATGENRFGPKQFFTTTAAPGTSSTRRGIGNEEDSSNTIDDSTAEVNGPGVSSPKYKDPNHEANLATSPGVTRGLPSASTNPASMNSTARPRLPSSSSSTDSDPPSSSTLNAYGPNGSSPSKGSGPNGGSTPSESDLFGSTPSKDSGPSGTPTSKAPGSNNSHPKIIFLSNGSGPSGGPPPSEPAPSSNFSSEVSGSGDISYWAVVKYVIFFTVVSGIIFGAIACMTAFPRHD